MANHIVTIGFIPNFFHHRIQKLITETENFSKEEILKDIEEENIENLVPVIHDMLLQAITEIRESKKEK